MKQSNCQLSLIFIFLLLWLAPARGLDDPFVRDTAGRPLALGSAYTGLSNDGSGFYINPAGLSEISINNFISLYSQPLNDISLTSLAGALPNYYSGTTGLGYRNRGYTNVLVSTETANYTEQDLTLLYAKKINDRFSVGGDVRLVMRGLSKDVPGYEALNGSGLSVDTGLKYRFQPYLEGGAVIRNLVSSLNNRAGGSENLDSAIWLGLSAKVLGKNSWSQIKKGALRINLDLNKIADEPLSQFHLGGEYKPNKLLALRFGLDQTPNTRSENYLNFTAGFGFNYQGIVFDYAYKKWADPSQSVSHYFSLGFQEEDEDEWEWEAKKPPKTFSDVPANYWAKQPIEYLTSIGVLDYYPDGTFRPERSPTRTEAVIILVNAKDYHLPEKKKQVFGDVPPSFFAADYIQSAWENKLVLGYPDGTFKPRQATTRAEGVTMLSRFDGLSAKGIEVLPFPDLGKNHWALKEILAAKEAGLLDYLTGQDFKPSTELSRAELAELLYRTNFIKSKAKVAYWE